VPRLSQSLRGTLGLVVLAACGTFDARQRVYFYAVDASGMPYDECTPGSWDNQFDRRVWNGRRTGNSIDGRIRFTEFIAPHWDHDSLSVACVGSSDTVTVAVGRFVHGTATVERVVLQRESLPGPGRDVRR